jgi:hypothetical protein
MIIKRKKFLVLSSILMIIGLTLAACQPFAATSDRLSEGIKSSESESRYSFLPGGLVNLGTEKLPIGVSQSSSPYSGLVNLRTEQLPIAVSEGVLEGSAEVAGIPPEFLPEWVKLRVASAEKANLQMLEAAVGVASIPFDSTPERAEQFVEKGLASAEAQTSAKKVLLDILSTPRIVVEYQRFTGSMVKFNSSLEPEPIVLGQKESDSSVVIQEVISVGQGWVLIHADEGGSPGKVIGSASVKDGVSFDVVVEVLPEYLGGAMHAMLHTDVGISGQLEYPQGPDSPVYAGSRMISEPAMQMQR